jgi:CO dehydrogenase maturation factor
MIASLDMQVKKLYLIVNRVPGGKLEPGIDEEIKLQKLSLIGIIPQDNTLYEFDAAGKALIMLPEDSPVKIALAEITRKVAV